VRHLQEENYKLLDCQVYNEHLESLGCREIAHEDFMSILKITSRPIPAVLQVLPQTFF
jgi:Leu/Phe-tRNA-protein transferase